MSFPGLRVYDPASPPASPADQYTLSTFTHEVYLPRKRRLKQLCPASADDKRFTLNHWVRATGDPPLSKIDDELLAHFLNDLSARVSLVTANKHLRNVGAILNYAGPRGYRRPYSLGWLEIVPAAPPFRTVRRLPRTMPPEVLTRLWIGCEAATRPRSPHYRTADWYRSLIYTVNQTALRWWDARMLETAWLNFESGWLDVTPQKVSAEQRFQLHASVLAWILRIHTGGRFLFDWPGRQRAGQAGKTAFRKQWHKIQDAAGIPKTMRRVWGFQGIRKARVTEVAHYFSPAEAQRIAGHRQLSTTQTFYNDPTELMQRVNERIPQPAFARETAERQLELF